MYTVKSAVYDPISCLWLMLGDWTGIGQRGGIVQLAWRIGKPFMKSLERGAQSSIFLASAADPTPFHGQYVVGRRPAPTDPAAQDDALARRLWDKSACLVGL